MHLVQHPLVAANVGCRGLQAWRVNELHPDTSHRAIDLPDAARAMLKGMRRCCLISIQNTVDGGALANATHANDHDSAGKGKGLAWSLAFLLLSLAAGCLKAVHSAAGAAGLGHADALSQVQPVQPIAVVVKEGQVHDFSCQYKQAYNL